ncbi:MAG: FecR domain-containing protein [Terriglobia bacterium]|jgi:hypothetical protein
MRLTLSLISLLALCGAVVLAGPIPINGNEKDTPQIVRVSYAQGEVKLSPGVKGKPVLGKDWVVADVNSPIEEGAILATEDGRAEVEFENGSVTYLAEHSVLQFEQLTSNSQKTSTVVALLTGRATFAVGSNGHDEITIDTPVVQFHTNQAMTMRVESALDGSVFRMVEGSMQVTQRNTGKKFPLRAGEAFQVVGGVRSWVTNPTDDPDQKAWDHWVGEESAARRKDIEIGLKESGLAAPIPGLVDLVRQGTFSDCPPYGICWEPKEGEATESLQQEKPAETAEEGARADKKAQISGGGTRSPQQGGKPASVASQPGARYEWVSYASLDCPFVYSGRRLMEYTPQHPKGIVVSDQGGWSAPGQLVGLGWWATCHAGSWVGPRQEPRQARRFGCKDGKPCKVGKRPPPPKRWVVGPKSKRGSFWRVRVGNKVGFIPKHPWDGKGKPPLHARDGVLMVREKDGHEVLKIKSAPKDLQIEKNLPAGYETKWAKDLPRVGKPVIEGRLLNRGYTSSGAIAKLTGSQRNQSVIHYDYKTRNFVEPANAAIGARGNERPVVVAHVGSSRGNGSSGGWQNGGGWAGGGSRGSSSSSRGSSGSSGYSGGGGSGSSHGSSYGGGGSSHGSSSGGGSASSGSSGGGSSSHASSGGGGGGSSGGGGGGGGSQSSSASAGGGGRH